MVGADDVRIEGGPRVVLRGQGQHPAQMKDPLYGVLLDAVHQHRQMGQGPLLENEAPAEFPEGSLNGCNVEENRSLARFDQKPRNIGPDETGAACDQGGHE